MRYKKNREGISGTLRPGALIIMRNSHILQLTRRGELHTQSDQEEFSVLEQRRCIATETKRK